MTDFAYELKDIKPNEAEFIMAAISSVSAPLNVSGPIYTKIQAQIESQNEAYLKSQEQQQKGMPDGKEKNAE